MTAAIQRRQQNRRANAGFTLIELIVASFILAILSMVALPMARIQLKRVREHDLRIALRDMRTAIDRYKDASDTGVIQVDLGTDGYPKDLDTLVEGVPLVNSPDGKKLKLLRRVPVDPMTNNKDWGLRAYKDDPDSTEWGGDNVFDVYTKSQDTALDGSKYSAW